MNVFTVDFAHQTGTMKPVHGVCCAPYVKMQGKNQRTIAKYFKEGNIPYCRLHDCGGAYGGSYFVDIPNIFPDFDADENDPASYDFHYTDEYIGGIQAAGCEAYYRLGVTIEWGSKKITSLPPKDFGKWARICEHVVRHYNEGWADGFHYNLKYWEIWNEPENPGNAWGPCMWGGTKEEFFELYRITAKHLRACFPGIKIGGFGSCGFYPLTSTTCPESYKEFIVWFHDFLKMAKETGTPLDFFSWHIYTGDINELLTHAKYVRETLDDYGFTETEAHLNEWNVNAEGGGFAEKHTMVGASFNAAVLALLQNTRYVDIACYYCFHTSSYNGFQNQNDGTTDLPWYSFVAYGQMYALGTAVAVESEAQGVYAVAAKNAVEKCVMISNYDSDDTAVTLKLNGLDENELLHLRRLDNGKVWEEEFAVSVSGKTELRVQIPRQSVLLLSTAEV